MDYFPFEQYTFSCCEKEYFKDVRKRNYLIKYVNLISVDNLDYISLRRFVLISIFFRNIFCKDAFIEFFLDSFDFDSKQALSFVVYDMFVRSKKGIIGEHKDYLNLIVRLQEFVDYDSLLIENWNKIKEEMPEII